MRFPLLRAIRLAACLAVAALSDTRAATFGLAQTFDAGANIQDNGFFGGGTSTDGNWLVIGALGENTRRGAAYVYRWNGSNWEFKQRLVASNRADNDEFGSASAIDGDTLMIGAANRYVTGPSQGAVYVFHYSGTTWSEVQILSQPSGIGAQYFGGSIEIEGTTALIGASYENSSDNLYTGAGAVYVYTSDGTTWTKQQKLFLSNPQGGDRFGYSIALDGGTAIIGAYGTDSPLNSGSAFVYTRSGGAWSQRQKLIAGDAIKQAAFGSSVALEGSTAIIGSRERDNGPQAGNGAAYVFTRTGDTWSQAQKLYPSSLSQGASFGSNVQLLGKTAVIGAPNQQNGAGIVGAAFVYTKIGEAWLLRQTLFDPSPASFESFSGSLALTASQIIAGNTSKNSGGSSRGIAYAFSSDGSADKAPAIGLKGTKTVSVPATRSATLKGVCSPSTEVSLSVSIKGKGKATTKKIKVAANGSWKFVFKPKDPRTVLTFTSTNPDGLKFATLKVTVVKKKK